MQGRTAMMAPDYSGRRFTQAELERGAHRAFIGGNWELLGRRQLDFLVAQGLKPTDRFVDIGCGCLRAGRHLVDYLDPGHYWGVDANADLIRAGYERELIGPQRARLPRENLRVDDRFDVDFGVQFDMAIAQSLFTHVSLNHVRLCLHRLAGSMRPGGVFYATFFEQRPGTPLDRVVEGAHKQQFSERNVYWYYASDLQWAATVGPWRYRYIGKWGHPRGQRMVEFTRIPDPEWAGSPAARGGRTRKALVARARRKAAEIIAP